MNVHGWSHKEIYMIWKVSLMDTGNKRHSPLSEHVWFKLAKPEGHHVETKILHKDLTRSYFSSMANACVHLTRQATSLLSSSATERRPKTRNTRTVARAYTPRQIAAAY